MEPTTVFMFIAGGVYLAYGVLALFQEKIENFNKVPYYE